MIRRILSLFKPRSTAKDIDAVWGVRQFLARRKLAKITAQRRNSYEVRRYRERRAAALKGRARA